MAKKGNSFDEVTKQIFSNHWIQLGLASTFGALFGYNLEHRGEAINGWDIGVTAAIMLAVFGFAILLLRAYFWFIDKSRQS